MGEPGQSYMGDERVVHVAVMDAFSAIYEEPRLIGEPSLGSEETIRMVSSMEMLGTGGTMETFTHIMMKEVSAWTMPNDRTLICPYSLAGLFSQKIFEMFGNLLLAFQVSSYASSFASVEEQLKGRWVKVGETVFSNNRPKRAIYKAAMVKKLENVPLPTDNNVVWARAKSFMGEIQVPDLKEVFPITTLPLLLSAGETYAKASQAVFPHDPLLAARILASIRDAINDGEKFQRIWVAAKNSARQSPLQNIQTIPESTREDAVTPQPTMGLDDNMKKQLKLFTGWVSSLVFVYYEIGTLNDIETLRGKTADVVVSSQDEVEIVVQNLKQKFGI